MSANENQTKRKRDKNAPIPSRAFMVTQIDFEGKPIKQTMLFTQNLHNKPSMGTSLGFDTSGEFKFPILNDFGVADVIRKTGLENVVIDNYVNTRKRKPATRPELMYIISKKKCVSLDVDSFIPGRFYLTFAPDSDGGDNDLSLVGTGLDLYWVVDDIKMFQMRGNANMAGVV